MTRFSRVLRSRKIQMGRHTPAFIVTDSSKLDTSSADLHKARNEQMFLRAPTAGSCPIAAVYGCGVTITKCRIRGL